MADTSSVLGTWNNAPLALVLAQIRFEPFQSLGIEELLDRFRSTISDEYPQTGPIHQMSIVLGAGSQPQTPQSPAIVGYDLITEDATRTVRLQPDAMTYTVTSYHDYPRFSEQWERLLAALSAIGDVRGQRLGLRYVDFIIPSDLHVPEDYVVAPIGTSPACLGETAPVVFNLYEYARKDGRLRIQYGRGYGQPDYPPDLQGMVIPPSRLRARYTTGLSAVLDMDRWCEVAPVAGTTGQFLSAFQQLHDDMSSMFRSIITPLAKAEWGCRE